MAERERTAEDVALQTARAAAIEAHVTDTEAPVYGIVDLPEEVVAVILAFVSRSSKSFRDNLGELVAQGLAGGAEAAGGAERTYAAATDRARAFHERWVVNYGHASVAEHATVHLGVERISRLASAALELSNPFLSFTEYSQRYQAPRRGGYVTPPELQGVGPELGVAYAELQERLFDAYEALREGVAEHLLQSGAVTAKDGEAPEATMRRARRRAFEDARYALPLATHTALGLTANGRSLRDAIALLAESPWAEVRALAESLRGQGERMLPTLLRHAEPAVEPPDSAPVPVDRSWLGAWGAAAGDDADVRLLTADAAGPALGNLAAALAIGGDANAAHDPVAYLRSRREQSGPYAAAHGAMRAVRYRFALRLSEANWHQLLRHVRGMGFFAAPAGVEDGLTVPPLVEAAGLGATLVQAADRAADLYGRLVAAGAPGAAAYVVTNAHRRLVVADLDLWELDHLVRLRLKDNAQWDVRRTVRAMVREAIAVQPFLRDLWGAEVETALADEPR